jgi:predicted RNA binding protein YcfA (HicA-like mRNA interferase family)
MRSATALIDRFERAGFTLVRSNGHQIWRCPCGHRQVTSPSTPGRGRSTQNMEAEIARTLKACKPQTKECT